MRFNSFWTEQGQQEAVEEKVRGVVGVVAAHLDCIIMVLHVDERKSSRPAGVVVINNLNPFHRAVMLKHLAQITLLCVHAQSKHTEAPACLGVLLKNTHTHITSQTRRGTGLSEGSHETCKYTTSSTPILQVQAY